MARASRAESSRTMLDKCLSRMNDTELSAAPDRAQGAHEERLHARIACDDGRFTAGPCARQAVVQVVLEKGDEGERLAVPVLVKVDAGPASHTATKGGALGQEGTPNGPAAVDVLDVQDGGLGELAVLFGARAKVAVRDQERVWRRDGGRDDDGFGRTAKGEPVAVNHVDG